MKRILAAALAAFASLAFGATTVPPAMLNPAGSTSGQAIVSTGASSAPAWGSVGVSGLSAIAANTVVANASAAAAAPTAFVMPSCSTTSSALRWTSGTGFSCGTTINATTLGGSSIGTTGATIPLLNTANTWSATQAFAAVAATTGTFTGAITPSQTAGIVGTTTNNSANAGSVGEYITATGSAVSLTSATPTQVASITLTPGDWDVDGSIGFSPAATTTVTQVAGAVNTSVALASMPFSAIITATLTTGAAQAMRVPVIRQSLSASQTLYLVAQSSFATSTMTATGIIRARRVR